MGRSISRVELYAAIRRDARAGLPGRALKRKHGAADAVALEARKLADREEPRATDLREDALATEKQELAPSSLTERWFRTQLRQDYGPLPAVDKYD